MLPIILNDTDPVVTRWTKIFGRSLRSFIAPQSSLTIGGCGISGKVTVLDAGETLHWSVPVSS